MATGFILSSASTFTTATMNSASEYLSATAYLIYYVTLAVLVAQWTTSMQREIGSGARWARIIAYISIGLVVLTTLAAIFVMVYFQKRIDNILSESKTISSFFHDYEVASKVFYGLDISCAIILCLVSIWMCLVCPKESKVAGSNKKRWQIGMAVFVELLLVLYTALADLFYAIVAFVFIMLLGIVTLYPTHTLSGHAEPPASSRSPKTSPANV
ncbi:hypothetical protein THASP1DRAFT_32985 [Thamnocephalis sphaerospora]|uniref:Uncharacterized protein n=1 Tax=Thamnocephalis sphaerospora TaxID=78915 RepID=A0A4P9XHK1_9FUNG|nr:hypothetical protein THASP1DRAFT_32985 [Thamnocephalis sphaerospora]|eukprot:RKP05174.1 hypothetical protein THASP1DRAFT_32985 [Thamnocephalis sphaerospora]